MISGKNRCSETILLFIDNSDRFALGLITFFQRAGFGNIFGDTADLPPLSEAHPLRVSTDSTLYTNGSILVSWDQPLTTNGKLIDHTRVYLVDAVTKANLMDLSGDIRGQLFTDIAISSLGQSFAGPVIVKVVDWPVGATNNAEAISGFSNPITVEWDGSGMETMEHLSDDPVENEILNKIAQHLPVDTSHNWFNYLESPDHKGITLNAVDLNYGNPGDDADAPIYAVDGGVVHKIDKSGDVSILVLRHTLPSGQTWDSVYMHMLMVERANEAGTWDLKNSAGTIIATLKEGDQVSAGQHIAANGKEGTGGEHVHFEAHTGDWRSSPSINLDSLLRSHDIFSRIEAGGRSLYEVSYNTALQQWVNEADRVIAYIPSGDSLAAAYMVAWEDGKSVDQMEMVVWKSIQVEGEPEARGRWVKFDDDTKEWDKDSGEFVTISVVP
ncbi:MAG: M23 family metallopeptidase [Candidatus Peribacter sp.]